MGFAWWRSFHGGNVPLWLSEDGTRLGSSLGRPHVGKGMVAMHRHQVSPITLSCLTDRHGRHGWKQEFRTVNVEPFGLLFQTSSLRVLLVQDGSGRGEDTDGSVCPTGRQDLAARSVGSVSGLGDKTVDCRAKVPNVLGWSCVTLAAP